MHKENNDPEINFRQAQYVMGAAKLDQLPEDTGIEVAFAGRSNAGKSSVLNCLTDNKSLARTSKTPGRTQLINLFSLTESQKLVDLPGYGFAKVSQAVKQNWQKTLSQYLEQRQCLKGLVLLMDIRHPLKDTDIMLAQWASECRLDCHILLNKADKLGRNDQMKARMRVTKFVQTEKLSASVQIFSALKKTGLDELKQRLNHWYTHDCGPSDHDTASEHSTD